MMPTGNRPRSRTEDQSVYSDTYLITPILSSICSIFWKVLPVVLPLKEWVGPNAMVDLTLNRRSMLATTAAAVSDSLLFGGQAAAPEPSSKEELATREDTIPPLEFYFPNALLNADGEPLTDDSMVAVTAEPTADFTDAKACWKGGSYDQGYREDGA